MTKEEMEELKGLAASMGLYDDKNPCKRAVILGKAIKALEQEPCEDCISRQAVEDAIAEMNVNGESLGYSVAYDILSDLPPVNPQEKTGHWIIKIKSDLRGDMWPTNPKCSVCGGEPYYSNTIYDYKFCPYCGAKMVEPQERSDKE